MPDDLSYDDFSFYNPQGPRTPNIDGLERESIRLTDFHVSPTCSPSRASLMTGRYNDATGVWHTIKGREWLRPDEVTMAEVFRANGYRTALVGKWHLGDSYPFCPLDRGFDYVAAIRGGGIDQQPDYWGNTNLPPTTLFVDDRPVPLTDEHTGIPGAYSTNFFTDRAIDYMKDCAARAEPFFVYLPYNVGHVPLDMPPDARPGVDKRTGTVENLDKNIGRLLAFLRSSHLEDGTILVFLLSDNGMSTALWRGGKSDEYEAGHRVACLIRWKDGGLGGAGSGGGEMPYLASHIDWLPTFMDLLGLHDVARRSPRVPIQGRSLRPLLEREPADNGRSLWNRVLVVDNQRFDHLQKYKQCCVMQDETDLGGRIVRQWRLTRDSASADWGLYDLLGDPKQTTDLSGRPEYAGRVAAMQADYEAWWTLVSARGAEYSRAVLGAAAQPRVCLYSHDWHNDDGDAGVPWNQGMVAAGLRLNGFNSVEFARSGTWRFDLRRWPEEIAGETTLTSALRTPVAHGFRNGDRPTRGVALPIHSARIRIWNGERTYADARMDVDPQADGAVFTLAGIPAGPAMIQTWFYDASGQTLGGAYYDYVEYAQTAPPPARPVPSYLSSYAALYAASPHRAARQWFVGAQYGLMVVYCLASLPEKGQNGYFALPAARRDQDLFARFTASAFDADRIADLAAAGGMKYVTFITQHLDGLYLWDTALSDFNSVRSPARRDLVAEMAAACAKRGLGLFLYVPPDASRTDGAFFRQNQLRLTELLSHYGAIAGIWFDGINAFHKHPENYRRVQELFALVRRLQPQCLVSWKTSPDGTDFLAPEHAVGSFAFAHPELPVEVCTTMQECTRRDLFPGENGWIDNEAVPHLSAAEVLMMIRELQLQGAANVLLSIGLRGDGSIHPADEAALRAAGAYRRAHWPARPPAGVN